MDRVVTQLPLYQNAKIPYLCSQSKFDSSHSNKSDKLQSHCIIGKINTVYLHF